MEIVHTQASYPCSPVLKLVKDQSTRCRIQGSNILCKTWYYERELQSLRCKAMAEDHSFNTDGKFDASMKWNLSGDSRTDDVPTVNNSTFCIIEGPETVQDFAQMQLQEIRDNIRSRRNKIFLLLEEVRRLRIQQRIKSAEQGVLNKEDNEILDFPSFIPFLPPLTAATLKQYYVFCFALVAGIIFFGGFLAPMLELKLGLGGTSYEEFIHNMHLPPQLSQVDPVVASFSGGAVGVISSLMVVEYTNVKQQEQKRCKYCHGTGYLACARCSGTGVIMVEPLGGFKRNDQPSLPPSQRCPNCSGSARVMCPTCFCTGMAMASEHDPRIDPFD